MPFNRSHIKIPGIEWSEMDQHLRSCVDVGLLRIRTEGQEGGFVRRERDKDAKAIRKMRDAGQSYSEIADELGRSKADIFTSCNGPWMSVRQCKCWQPYESDLTLGPLQSVAKLLGKRVSGRLRSSSCFPIVGSNVLSRITVVCCKLMMARIFMASPLGCEAPDVP
jgi:hypothetical protein